MPISGARLAQLGAHEYDGCGVIESIAGFSIGDLEVRTYVMSTQFTEKLKIIQLAKQKRNAKVKDFKR